MGWSLWGREESDTTERLHFHFSLFTFHFSLSCIGEGNGNPLQCYCLENPRDGVAWWAAIYGVAQSQTRLKRLSSKDNLEPQEQGASFSIVNWKDERMNCISSTHHIDEILGIILEWASKLSPIDESQGRISSLVVSSLPFPIPKLTPLLEISEELDEAEDHQLIMFYRGSFLSLKQVKANNLPRASSVVWTDG